MFSSTFNVVVCGVVGSSSSQETGRQTFLLFWHLLQNTELIIRTTLPYYQDWESVFSIMSPS